MLSCFSIECKARFFSILSGEIIFYLYTGVSNFSRDIGKVLRDVMKKRFVLECDCMYLKISFDDTCFFFWSVVMKVKFVDKSIFQGRTEFFHLCCSTDKCERL